MDFVFSNILLPIGALASTLAIGYAMEKVRLKTGFGNDPLKLFAVWYIFIRYILPVVILLVFILQLV